MKSGFLELGKDILIYGFMAGVSRLTGFLLLPLFTRVFSVDDYGIIDIVATVTALISTFIGLSLPSALARYFYESDSNQEHGRLVSTLLVCISLIGAGILLAGGIFSELIAGLLLNNSDHSLFILLAALTAVFSALTSIPQMVLRMERRIVRFNLLNILYSLFYAGLALYFVYVQSIGLTGVFLAAVLAGLLQFLLALTWIRQYLTIYLSYEYLVRTLRFSLPLLPAVLVGWVNNQADRLILLALLGLNWVGIFGAAARISLIVRLLTGIFNQAWIPYAMSLIQAPMEERNRFYRRALNYYAGGFASLGLILVAISPEMLQILVPPAYFEGYVVIPWLVGSAILHASGSITNIGVVISEKTIINSIAAWSGAFTNILLSLVLISFFGITGAAIGTFVAELIFTVTLWHYTNRHTTVNFQTQSIIIILSCYIITSILLIQLFAAIQMPLLSYLYRLGVLIIALALIASQSIDKPAWRTITSAVGTLQIRFQKSIG